MAGLFTNTDPNPVEFKALVLSLGPEFPIRILDWRYKSIPWEEYMELSPAYRDEMENIRQWISLHISEEFNRYDDQPYSEPFDMGVYSVTMHLSSVCGGNYEYPECEDNLEIVNVVPLDTDKLDWK